MNQKKEQLKIRVFLILYIIFIILTFIGAFMVIMHKLNNAGYAVVPMLFCLIFGMLYRNSKKEIEGNKR